MKLLGTFHSDHINTVLLAIFKTGLLTRCGKKEKIVQVLGGNLCGKKRRLCGNCAGLRNRVNKQIFDHRAHKKTPDMEEFLDK